MVKLSKSATIVGVILAGGKASRMNGMDKSLLPLGQQPLIEHVIETASPQVDRLAISVNHSQKKYLDYRLPLIPDIPSSSAGPLVGIYSVMKWYLDQEDKPDYLACFPGDVPLFPADIVRKLIDALDVKPAPGEKRPKVAWCQTGTQIQPLFSLWDISVFPLLKNAVESGVYGPKLFFKQHANCRVLLPPQPPGFFFNINTLEQLQQAESILANSKKL